MDFPIIVLKEDDMIYGFKKSKDFLITTNEGIERGVYDTGLIIDLNGNKFELCGATQVGWGNIFLGLTLLRKGRLILIEPKLNRLGESSFSEIKDLIIEQLKRGENHWIPYGGVSLMIEVVSSVKSKSELINVFSK